MIFENNNLKALRGCLVCVAKQDARYYLEGLNITEAEIQGTDGYRIVWFEHKQENPIVGTIESFKVLASTVRLELVKNNDSMLVYQWNKKGVKSVTVIEFISGTYPNIHAIATSVTPQETIEIGIDATLIADVQKATKSNGVKLTLNGSMNAISVSFTNLSELKMICMPMRL